MLKTIIAGAALALLSAFPAFAACTEISSKTIALTGCIDSEWQAIEGTGAQEFSYLTADQNFGLMLITEKEVIPAAQFREAIIQNAITGSGGTADDVKTVRERIVNIDGKPFNVIEYTIPNSGSPILFQNFYYSAPGYGSLQILAYSLETEATASAFRAGIFAATAKVGD
ncbi:MAG TPA: hypothetical protein VFE52_11330 [Devosia sp.]|nr:hypothetical protein [Devosia sp.]